MAKGVKKTILEKQINIYNQFQYQNRQTDRLGLSRNQPVTIAEQIARNCENANIAKLKKTREDRINKIREEQPRYSIGPDFTAEDRAYWVTQEILWQQKLHAAMKS